MKKNKRIMGKMLMWVGLLTTPVFGQEACASLNAWANSNRLPDKVCVEGVHLDEEGEVEIIFLRKHQTLARIASETVFVPGGTVCRPHSKTGDCYETNPHFNVSADDKDFQAELYVEGDFVGGSITSSVYESGFEQFTM